MEKTSEPAPELTSQTHAPAAPQARSAASRMSGGRAVADILALQRGAGNNANFATFLNHALAGSPPLGGDVDLAALKVHAAHSGFLTWAQVANFGSIPDLVGFIYGHVSRQRADAIVVETKWRAMAPKP